RAQLAARNEYTLLDKLRRARAMPPQVFLFKAVRWGLRKAPGGEAVLDALGKLRATLRSEACRIGLACVYCHALGAVQGRTAWSRGTETLRRRRASSRRRGTGDTGRKRRCSISSWPSTIRSSGIVGWPKGERCRGTSKTSSKPISSAVCLSTDFFASSAILVRRRSWLRIAASAGASARAAVPGGW